MSKELEALKSYDKIDNILCLNNNRNNIEFAISEDENLDCKNAYEMVECLDNIKQALIKAQEKEKENAKYKQLEKQLGCPLDVFIKLLFEQKIWIEVNGKMYLTENIDFSIELELQEDETFINTLEDYGESTFWAWYHTRRNSTDHVVLKLKDYKKTWWLREDKSE